MKTMSMLSSSADIREKDLSILEDRLIHTLYIS